MGMGLNLCMSRKPIIFPPISLRIFGCFTTDLHWSFHGSDLLTGILAGFQAGSDFVLDGFFNGNDDLSRPDADHIHSVYCCHAFSTIIGAFFHCFIIVGCNQLGESLHPPQRSPHPGRTPTSLGTPDLTNPHPAFPTPTLRVHEVASGEVLGYIAGRYGWRSTDRESQSGMNPMLTIGKIPSQPVPGSNIASSGSTMPLSPVA